MFITYTVEVFALENLTNAILNRSTTGLSVNLTGLTYNMEYVARVYARNSQKVGKKAQVGIRIPASGKHTQHFIIVKLIRCFLQFSKP